MQNGGGFLLGVSLKASLQTKNQIIIQRRQAWLLAVKGGLRSWRSKSLSAKNSLTNRLP